MNILADENIEALIIARLRADGHSVTAIAEMHSGIPDTSVLQLAIQLQALLLTSDKDFGDLVFLRRMQAPIGLILIRLPETISSLQKVDIVSRVLHVHALQLTNAFTVIALTGVRITALP